MEILRKKLMQIKRNIVYFDECFTIKVLNTSSNATGTLKFNNSFKINNSNIKYSINNGTINTYWDDTDITVIKGDTIKIYAELKGIMPEWPSVNDSNFSGFINANFFYEAYGNLNSLVYGIKWNDDSEHIPDYRDICSEQQFANLFANDDNIKSAKNLVFPYTDYDSCACYHMFNNCENLEYGPEYLGYAYPKFDINNIDKDDPINGVSSANMGRGYGTMYGMFENCINMKKGPECLYLNIHMYESPTNGGSYYPNYPSSIYNPNYNNGINTDLPKFFGGHLSRMFNNCTSLTEAPKILLLDAYSSSCAGMFGNNTNLKLIELYISKINNGYTQIVPQGDPCIGLFVLDNDYENSQYGTGEGGITFSDNANKAPKNLNIHYYINSRIASSDQAYITGETRAWPTTDGFYNVETTEITEDELPAWIPDSI